jgi:lipid-A-disaccharide synthase
MISESPHRILVSAGEASGDLYAALLVTELQHRWPGTHFFGCTGPRLRAAGVETVVLSEKLAVVGLVEVLAHIPRIYHEYRRLLAAVDAPGPANHPANRPSLAILTDSPDFHLRLARQLALRGIPVVYLVAPQVWAWRQGRVRRMRRDLAMLLCIFPFEEAFFRRHRVPVTYIGHPLVERVRPALSKVEFFTKHDLPMDRPLIVLLPGSRRGESVRHMPALVDAAAIIGRERPAHFVLPASPNTGVEFFRAMTAGSSIQVIEGEAWDAIAHADLALAASGTVTVEAALLGTPMVTFYRVNPISWFLGKMLVRIPFYCMVNLIAGRKIVPELMQNEMTGANLAAAASRVLENKEQMKTDLAEVRNKLSSTGNAISRAAAEVVHVAEGVRLAEASHV